MTGLDQLQLTLAGEYAAVYLLGVVGGRTSASREPLLERQVTDAYAVHRARRDQLQGMIQQQGGAPVAAAVSYELPNPCRTAAQLRATALSVEERSSALYADLVAHTARGVRLWAIDALTDAAVRSLTFGGTPTSFPGAPELT